MIDADVAPDFTASVLGRMPECRERRDAQDRPAVPAVSAPAVSRRGVDSGICDSVFINGNNLL